MSLDLTRAEIADRIAKCKNPPTRAQMFLLMVFLLMFAAAFGQVLPCPIRGY